MNIAILTLTLALYGASTAAYIAYLFRQEDRLQRTGFRLMGGGFLVHAVAIGYAAAVTGRVPVTNLHQTLLVAGWTVSGVFLMLQHRLNVKVLGIVAAPLVTLMMGWALWLPSQPLQPPQISLESFWLVAHVAAVFMGDAAFALACGIGILYLIQEHGIKTKKRGFFFSRLPSLDLLDNAGYVCLIVGFTLLTIGLATGFVYARSVWGRFWSWDPKEVWSGITWLVYAALLHERLTVGWRGRKAAIMSIIGFGVILFTFLGVNFLLKGHHGDFTRW